MRQWQWQYKELLALHVLSSYFTNCYITFFNFSRYFINEIILLLYLENYSYYFKFPVYLPLIIKFILLYKQHKYLLGMIFHNVLFLNFNFFLSNLFNRSKWAMKKKSHEATIFFSKHKKFVILDKISIFHWLV